MGGAVSAGAHNDELIDHLVAADIIRSSDIEKVFRAVDRGHYYTDDYKELAYRDTAWKDGYLHLSAPCIYSEVMEYLELKPGLSFLNFGSGTGYLSTMVGLILGKTGINHGVELHKSVVDYAYKKLEEFKENLASKNEYDFSEPIFVAGNCLKIAPETIRRYDRIYVGTACSESDEPYMKQFIKVGGLLVMPLEDQLIVINRISETEFGKRYVYAVSFATIARPNPDEPFVKLPPIDPVELKELCRGKVKSLVNLSSCQQNEEWQKSPERRILTFYNIIDETSKPIQPNKPNESNQQNP